jgi:integrase
MAFLEQRGSRYRVIFTFHGKRYCHSLHSSDFRTADAVRGSIDRTVLQIQQRLIAIPDGADVKEFILNSGAAPPKAAPVIVEAPCNLPQAIPAIPAPEPVTLAELRDQYLATMGIGVIEQNSLDTIAMHLRHFEKKLGKDFCMQGLSLARLQAYVVERAKEKGIHKRSLSPATIRKEIASLRAAWNWAVHTQLLTGPFPNRGLKFPKTTEKPPFQTWAEIERQLGQSKLSEADKRALWDCVFLAPAEIEGLLQFVKTAAAQPWVYPMFCFAAYTGARRSEMIRARLSDLDLDGGTVRIQEKKRVQGRHTSRRVPLSRFLIQVLREWLAVHPGGTSLFCQQSHVFRSKKRRAEPAPVTRDEAHDHFKRTLAGSKWEVLRGWHVLRHSFCSCCAAKGIDQRFINAWVGHQTEEMVQRYRHLFPTQERQAISSVFD